MQAKCKQSSYKMVAAVTVWVLDNSSMQAVRNFEIVASGEEAGNHVTTSFTSTRLANAGWLAKNGISPEDALLFQ